MIHIHRYIEVNRDVRIQGLVFYRDGKFYTKKWTLITEKCTKCGKERHFSSEEDEDFPLNIDHSIEIK